MAVQFTINPCVILQVIYEQVTKYYYQTRNVRSEEPSYVYR